MAEIDFKKFIEELTTMVAVHTENRPSSYRIILFARKPQETKGWMEQKGCILIKKTPLGKYFTEVWYVSKA